VVVALLTETTLEVQLELEDLVEAEMALGVRFLLVVI
jgi:hypothetical protein